MRRSPRTLLVSDELELSLGDVLTMLRKAAPAVYQETLVAVKELGAEAAKIAREKAEQQGFSGTGRSGRGTGRLFDGIGYSTRGPVAILRETASANGYPYPAVFEFGRKEPWMDRPFLFPAIRDLEPEAIARVEQAVDSALARIEA